MSMLKQIESIAEKLGLGNISNPETKKEIEIKLLIKSAYDKHMETDSERIYHSLGNHILPLLEYLLKLKALNFFMDKMGEKGLELIFWAILFHDCILDTRKFGGENERNSNKFFEDEQAKLYPSLGEENRSIVSGMILSSYGHESNGELTREFLKMDLSGFYKPFNEVLEDELKVRAEYGWVDWAVYKDERIRFFKTYAENSVIKEMGVSEVLKTQAQYMEFVQPKIVVFPGTFKHWHKGHHDVYMKLKKIFDKVIVVFAINHEKEKTERHIPEVLKNTQVEFVPGSLMEWVESLPYPVTIARGIRNSTDLLAEQTYIRWLNEFAKKPINVVSIFSDPALEHISSSALKVVEQLDPNKIKNYIHE